MYVREVRMWTVLVSCASFSNERLLLLSLAVSSLSALRGKADLEQIMQKNRGKCTTTCDAKLGVERECRVGASGAARIQGHPRAMELHPRVMDSLDRSPPVTSPQISIRLQSELI